MGAVGATAGLLLLLLAAVAVTLARQGVPPGRYGEVLGLQQGQCLELSAERVVCRGQRDDAL